MAQNLTNEKFYDIISIKLDTYSLSESCLFILAEVSVITDNLFEKLECYRLRNNLTVTKLVELVGISRTTYYEWKNNNPPAKIIIYKKVEQFLSGENYEN